VLVGEWGTIVLLEFCPDTLAATVVQELANGGAAAGNLLQFITGVEGVVQGGTLRALVGGDIGGSGLRECRSRSDARYMSEQPPIYQREY
jgi:hypothetical protein